MIITIYRPNGTKKRTPQGYGGGLCHQATKPYEKREVPGSVTLTPTYEAYQEPAVEAVETSEQIKQK
jgi:hypothetical protein